MGGYQKETGRDKVMQFRTQPDSHRNKQNEHFQGRKEIKVKDLSLAD